MATADIDARLIAGADASRLNLAQPSPVPAPVTKVPRVKVQTAAASQQPPALSCQQVLTLSFFFDGTGNNLEADVDTVEHSNVARLYRSHVLDSDVRGTYSFYLPGIGTYFMDREVQDKGGRMDGNGFGRLGQQRLDFAFARLREKVTQAEARAQNPTNKICRITVSVFGFSRGAALARAFCRDLNELCIADASSDTGWRLKSGRHPIEVSFLGLFDTVASSGLPAGANNAHRMRVVKALKWLASPIATTVESLVETPELKRLAFGNTPGADPASGIFDGHGGWADGLAIAPMVKRAHHIMAAHEVRNSFPLDTALYLQRTEVSSTARTEFYGPPTGCTETLYPGVHSDVGGGYRPGEGGCKPEKGAQLSLIALREMHRQAIDAGVPLVQFAAMTQVEREDFAIDEKSAPHFEHMAQLFQHYDAYARSLKIAGASVGLGLVINQHMRAYYAWRFRAIRQAQAARASSGGTRQEQQVQTAEAGFSRDRAAIGQDLQRAREDLYEAQRTEEVRRVQLDSGRMAEQRYGMAPVPGVAELTRLHEQARRETERRQIAMDKVRARADGAADDSKLNAAIRKFDQMLLDDARSIVAWMREDKTLRLRPHYDGLVQAYLDEFERRAGLADPLVIEFFDEYVHNSLAAFDTDGTWPSDPRILYVGGDNKLRYAAAPVAPEGRSAMAA